MKIELCYFEVMDALEKYVFEKYNMEINMYENTESCETENITFTRRPKKHKNGKDVKNEHGFIEYETDQMVHVLQVICGALAVIAISEIFIAVCNSRKRDDEDVDQIPD